MLVQSEQRRADAVGIEQTQAVTRVLGGNRVDLAQHAQGTRADVGQVADRGGHHIQ